MSDLRTQIIKLAYENKELRPHLLPLLKEAADTFECPECGTKVLEQTGYCVKCKEKVKKASEMKIARDPVSNATQGVGNAIQSLNAWYDEVEFMEGREGLNPRFRKEIGKAIDLLHEAEKTITGLKRIRVRG